MNTGRRAAVQAVLWVSYAALSLAMISAYMPLAPGFVLIMGLVAAGLWAATEGLRALVLRRGWLDLKPMALGLRLLLWPPLLAVVVQGGTFVIAAAVFSLGWLPPPPRQPQQGPGVWLGYVLNTSIMLWLWIGVWASWQYLSRWREGEIAKWRAEAAQRALELEVLRAQVNPHFMFNALNNLRALINEDPARAREMVTRLSNILRHTLYHSARERVPLADELAVVRDYIALEQLHHEERLQVHWQLDAAAESATLPPMLLQLLVENAIKHGITRTPGGGTIDIRIAREGDRLQVQVTNPGRWAPGPQAGIGLQHLRERLARAGGEGARCDVGEQAGQVQVTLTLQAA